jgi:hypothetical protein
MERLTKINATGQTQNFRKKLQITQLDVPKEKFLKIFTSYLL